MKVFPLFALTLALLSLLLNACKPAAETTSSGKPRVVATTTMVADLARRLAGDDAEVIQLMGPGVDPHLFKPGHEDIRHLQRADVILHSGLRLEGRLGEILDRLGKNGKAVFAAADGVPSEKILTDDGAPDPHIWGDASLWADCAKHLGEKLAGALPGSADAIRARAEAAVKELMDAHARLLEMANSLPEERRVLVTSHDAFRYFGRAYGFEVVGVQGVSTVSEAALSEIARVSDIIRSRGIKAIFTESSVSPAVIERIARDSGAKVGGELYSDALALPGTTREIDGRSVDAGTVAGMLEANMHAIVTALK